MINPAKRTKSIELSQVRKMFEITNPDAINLGIGEPDFDVPENIKQAMKDSIDDNETHYTPNKGYIELREEIVKKFKNDNGIKTNTDNIIVTVGASEALFMCAQAFIDKGDEVILPNPSFLSYEACINLAGGTIVPVDCKMENEFKLKADDVAEKITKDTKAIMLNSPSNPTGAVMEKEDIKAIADLSNDNDILVISDEIYEKIIYNKKHYSPGKYSDNVITLNGFSKAYAMTGLRIGYLNANETFNEELLKIHQYNSACASSTSQRGAYAALSGPQDEVTKMVAEFEKRRDLIVSRLNEMGYETVNAEGAFYVFPKIEDKDFVTKAAKAGVITVPGEAFGSNGIGHVRMSYANSYENIEKAMNILEERVVNG
ncbi:MAG: pyridoxal phosphate-dependent aminotransferase [Methanobrevibacter sp.]|jgi:aspartate aminotransferase|uniref:pyridoxal phosphate-dependent aminotransferase n=1 Tax=Methanobrevibacter sp. TaxID=66852 RepID=UPI0025EA098B|nr:pyridoxal phosphate-dependent aminotransferase [Methanobrevibacter sp.]MBE6498459.1 pyridoxal phosphate-dependent aminotransferase [Methanobrevibacter sp.]